MGAVKSAHELFTVVRSRYSRIDAARGWEAAPKASLLLPQGVSLPALAGLFSTGRWTFILDARPLRSYAHAAARQGARCQDRSVQLFSWSI